MIRKALATFTICCLITTVAGCSDNESNQNKADEDARDVESDGMSSDGNNGQEETQKPDPSDTRTEDATDSFEDDNGSIEITLENGTSNAIWIQFSNGNPSWYTIQKESDSDELPIHEPCSFCQCPETDCGVCDVPPADVMKIEPGNTQTANWDGVIWTRNQIEDKTCKQRKVVEPGSVNVEVCWGTQKEENDNAGTFVDDESCSSKSVEIPSEKQQAETVKLTVDGS